MLAFDRVFAWVIWAVAAWVVLMLFVGPVVVAEDDPATSTDGNVIFTTNCGTCHTLSDAGTSGAVGPNLDELRPTTPQVEAQVREGGGGMPAFAGKLTPAQIKAVSAYVAGAP